MRVVFLCGSLEPDCDGVGDYTRRLAGELIKQAHQVSIIALNDKYCSIPLKETQEVGSISIQVVRLPTGVAAKSRFFMARAHLEEFGPDWISLQYVPFSFHEKGLPFLLNLSLKELTKGSKLHIMFHELWVGVDGKVGFKMGLLKQAQKLIIRDLLRRTAPDHITTTIDIYRKQLPQPETKLLPLFGNIPIVPVDGYARKQEDRLRIVHFGSFTGLLDDFRSQVLFLSKAAQFKGLKAELVSFGEGGPHAEAALKAASLVLGKEYVRELGRLPPHEISLQLQLADVGISRSDFTMWGKSGATLAMLEHGLPVLLRGSMPLEILDPASTDLFTDQLLFCESGFEAVFAKQAPKPRLQEIAQKFIESLNKAEFVNKVSS
ncbi:glycosyltransferase [Rufibacter aurantiacus]|uniref:glycosyltransferase n=1 Tax=Rufibacter aurantiacus TaxID=2817374 RepID=UPI001B30DB15|nr:glycosyltransferase [Rufibacter aurantiacus]